MFDYLYEKLPRALEKQRAAVSGLLALVPALSAIKQANDGHDGRLWSVVHAAVLAAGASVGFWLYQDGVIGKVWIDRIAAMP